MKNLWERQDKIEYPRATISNPQNTTIDNKLLNNLKEVEKILDKTESITVSELRGTKKATQIFNIRERLEQKLRDLLLFDSEKDDRTNKR